MKAKAPSTLAAIGVVFLSGALWSYFHADRRSATDERSAAADALGQYVATHFPRETVLIVANPFAQRSGRPAQVYDADRAGQAGLRRALDGKVSSRVALPELRPGAAEHPESFYVDPQCSTPLSYLVADDAFDKLIEGNRDCTVIVSLIGLPSNLRQTRFWNSAKGPKLALLFPDLHFIGSASEIRAAFESGRIVAVLVAAHGAGKPEIVTGENAQRLLRQ